MMMGVGRDGRDRDRDRDRDRRGGRRRRWWRGRWWDDDLPLIALQQPPIYTVVWPSWLDLRYPATPAFFGVPALSGVNLTAAVAAPPITMESTMYGYGNPYNPYAQYYRGVGQVDPTLAAAVMPAPPFFGAVPVGPPVPALAALDLPTTEVLARIPAYRPEAAMQLQTAVTITPRTALLPGFRSKRKRICGHRCEFVCLTAKKAFQIEKLFVEGDDACKFEIKAIIVGQRVLSIGDGFPAKYLRHRGHRKHGFTFDLAMPIDFLNDLKILVHNKSHKKRTFKVLAFGRQIVE